MDSRMKWYYAWIKDSTGRLVETRFQGENKSDAYERIMQNEQVKQNHPELKLKDVHLSKFQR
jgi:hypothetical protein